MKTITLRLHFVLSALGIALIALLCSTPFVSGQTNQLPIILNELQVNPLPDSANYDGQFIELWNPNPFPVDLTGFTLRDDQTSANSPTIGYRIPGGTIAANSALALTHQQTGIILDTQDTVRLENAQGDPEDAFSYNTQRTGAELPAGDHYGRRGGEDGTGDWVACQVETPSQPNDPSCDGIQVPVKVSINEINPFNFGPLGQYIEIWNINFITINIGGYQIVNASTRAVYTIPENTMVGPNSGLAFPSSQTGLVFGAADTISLVDSNGVADDAYTYDTVADGLNPGEVYGRQTNGDGLGGWQTCSDGSVNGPNDSCGQALAVSLVSNVAEASTPTLIIIASALFVTLFTSRLFLRKR